MVKPFTYLLLRVDLDPNKDIEQVIGHLETIEHQISPLTRIDVIEVSEPHEDWNPVNDEIPDDPIIYYP